MVDLINREVAAVVWPEATEAAAMPLLMTALTVWGDTAVLAVVTDKIILRDGELYNYNGSVFYLRHPIG